MGILGLGLCVQGVGFRGLGLEFWCFGTQSETAGSLEKAAGRQEEEVVWLFKRGLGFSFVAVDYCMTLRSNKNTSTKRVNVLDDSFGSYIILRSSRSYLLHGLQGQYILKAEDLKLEP